MTRKQVTPLLILLAWWATHRVTPIYLVDFATFKAPDDWRISQAQVITYVVRPVDFILNHGEGLID